ncbi:E3 ubiquitin-protein ligase TRIM9 [Hypsibius exemplaris]|uniref:E3 ubiquitin-protein ligase TRIM9 n=1 Tax=Hypsibius exemplaris TaxID=2072580 RepID=A0A1W0XD31_HYPEX|nr:E3 ubiquitin-protein ligase TRIM9 [Hypsibius exemplaris]
MTEWISRVKATSARIPDVELDIEANIAAQCEHLVQLIHAQKRHMLDTLRQYREQKMLESRENAADCTALLQQATAQIQFGIEVLKETEAVNFLQFSAPLHVRVGETCSALDQQLCQTWSPELNLRFDSRQIVHSLENLELQHVVPPCAPRLNIEDCRIINGKISLSWATSDTHNSDIFILEVAETGGQFVRAYCGPDMKCCLNFSSQTMIYQARLKAANIAGESHYSNIVTLHVEGGLFNWDPAAASRDMVIGNDGLTLTSTASEDLVALASAGFVRGVHYWEIHIDRYDNHPDPAFGIATAGVKRDSMLGKDSNAWAVYIDAARSWCLHNNQHVNRMDGGIAAGCTVGILLDLDQRHLSFFVNDEPQAPIPAFQNLPEGLVFFPAVSINRNVQITLRPCLEPPSLSSSPE